VAGGRAHELAALCRMAASKKTRDQHVPSAAMLAKSHGSSRRRRIIATKGRILAYAHGVARRSACASHPNWQTHWQRESRTICGQCFHQGRGIGAPWECNRWNGDARQKSGLAACITMPFAALKDRERNWFCEGGERAMALSSPVALPLPIPLQSRLAVWYLMQWVSFPPRSQSASPTGPSGRGNRHIGRLPRAARAFSAPALG
jgi:hypothetical protein